MSGEAAISLQFDHAGVSVSNLARATSFYAGVLGFDRVEHQFELASHQLHGIVLCHPSGLRVELFEHAHSRQLRPVHPAEAATLIGWFQLAFRVPSVTAAFERSVAAGATPVLTPRTAPDGLAEIAFIADPDGNLIEFIQRPEP